MIFTYRSLFKTYPNTCNAIALYAKENRLLFEAALEEYIDFRGISVITLPVLDSKRKNKMVGYRFSIQVKKGEGYFEPIANTDEKIFSRDFYAWQAGVLATLDLLEKGFSDDAAKQSGIKITGTNSISRN